MLELVDFVPDTPSVRLYFADILLNIVEIVPTIDDYLLNIVEIVPTIDDYLLNIVSNLYPASLIRNVTAASTLFPTPEEKVSGMPNQRSRPKGVIPMLVTSGCWNQRSRPKGVIPIPAIEIKFR